MTFQDFGFVLRGQPCGRCGYPLPERIIRTVARDDDAPEVIELVLKGAINRIDCPNCSAEGWITSPFLWVDRQKARAVFVWGGSLRHDQIASERENLLNMALVDVDSVTAGMIRSRLQEVEYYEDIPHALAMSEEAASLERPGLEAFRRRAGLTPKQRLEQILSEASTLGGVVMEGFELSTAFSDLVKSEAALLDSNDASVRAQALRQLRDHVVQRSRAQQRLEEQDQKFSNTDQVGNDGLPGLFSRLLELDDEHSINSTTDPSHISEDNVEMGSETPQSPESENKDNPSALGVAIQHVLNSGRNREALVLARRMVDLARNVNDDLAITQGLYLAGAALNQDSKPREALQYLSEAYKRLVPLQLDDTTANTLAHVLEHLGEAYHLLRDAPRARHAYRSAIDLFAQLGHKDKECFNLMRLGVVYFELGERDEAAGCFRKVLAKSPSESENAVHARIRLATILSTSAPPPSLVIDVDLPGTTDQSPTEGCNDLAQPPERSLPEDQLAFTEDFISEEQRRLRPVVRVFTGRQEASGRRLQTEVLLGDEPVQYLLDARRIARKRGFDDLELMTYFELASVFSRYGLLLAARDSLDLGRRRLAEIGQKATPEMLLRAATIWESMARRSFDKGKFRTPDIAGFSRWNRWRFRVGRCEPIHVRFFFFTTQTQSYCAGF